MMTLIPRKPGATRDFQFGQRGVVASVALALVIVSLSACAPVLVAPYDRVTDDRLTAVAWRVDATLAAVGKVPYDVAAPFYEAVGLDLAVLRLRAGARAHNRIGLEQLDLIIEAWGEIEAQHRTAGRLSAAYVRSVRESLTRTIQAAIKSEVEKWERGLR